MASLKGVTQAIADATGSYFDQMLLGRIENSVIAARAQLIRQEYGRTRQFPAYAIFECLIPLIEEREGICGNALVTTVKLPKLIAVKDNTILPFVGTDARTAISHILPEEIELFKYNPVSGKLPRYTYMNKKAYFFNVDLDKALLRGPFADPRQLRQFVDEDGEPCFDEDDDDFIEEHAVQPIKSIVFTELRIKTDDHEVKVNGE